MLPQNFQHANITLTKPILLTDEQCGELPAFKGEIEGFQAYQVAYRPNVDDLHAIVDKRAVMLTIHSDRPGNFVRFSVVPHVSQGYVYFTGPTCGWLPSEAEKRMLKRGANVWIVIVGLTFAPITVFTFDKEGNING